MHVTDGEILIRPQRSWKSLLPLLASRLRSDIVGGSFGRAADSATTSGMTLTPRLVVTSGLADPLQAAVMTWRLAGPLVVIRSVALIERSQTTEDLLGKIARFVAAEANNDGPDLQVAFHRQTDEEQDVHRQVNLDEVARDGTAPENAEQAIGLLTGDLFLRPALFHLGEVGVIAQGINFALGENHRGPPEEMGIVDARCGRGQPRKLHCLRIQCDMHDVSPSKGCVGKLGFQTEKECFCLPILDTEVQKIPSWSYF